MLRCPSEAQTACKQSTSVTDVSLQAALHASVQLFLFGGAHVRAACQLCGLHVHAQVQAGHATRVDVHMDLSTGWVTVTDDGRGIPTNIHPRTGKSALETVGVVRCSMHTGTHSRYCSLHCLLW